MASVAKLPFAGTVDWLDRCIARGKIGVFAETTTLTPGLAAELLRRNENNRNVKAAKAEQYAADMRAGKWTFNGEPLIVSDDGRLNDGQHRCAALVDANTTLPVVIVFGLPRDSRLTVDQGAARGAGDYLSMDGVANANTSATIARLLIAYDRSNETDIDGRIVTNADVMARVHADDEIAAAAHYGVTMGRKANAYVAGTVIGFCYYLFSAIDRTAATEFLDGLCTGEYLRPQSPVLVCREKLLTMTKARQPKVAVIFRAWNMYRRGVSKTRTNSLISTTPLPALL